ncbi:DUF2017 family protein [Haloferula chungangensis]|uniref:DUF2017 family protein n=1 Tax=Haloferula chungangensis TaxID=1048331 RepID=A0ABW2L7V4_9BACT
MKAAPTLDGRIRIDIESKLDRMVMQSISHDARAVDGDLAERLGDYLGDEASTCDWEEFVLPDLKQGFNEQLDYIEQVLVGLDAETPGTIFIVKEDAETWYGALNQARLALEDRYHFDGENPDRMSPGRRTAWFRNQFYQLLQSMLLECLMRD